VEVPGATGFLDTNFEGKASYALNELREKDFVYLHVEAPDEAGHSGILEDKVRAIENFDKKVVGPVLEGMKKFDDYRILLLPDHATPLSIKTHSSDAVPFAVYPSGSKDLPRSFYGYNEKAAEQSSLFIEKGDELMDFFLTKA